jgi:hypothetical protein
MEAISGLPFPRGWGFGHKQDVGGSQGYSWGGKAIAPTVFEIAVKRGNLTATEAAKVLRNVKK